MDEPIEGQTAQEVAALSKKCVFCGHSAVLNQIGACSKCTERLMLELEKTREWKNVGERISTGVQNEIKIHESKKHR